MAVSRSEMAAIIPPAPISIVRREVPVSVTGLALVTSVSSIHVVSITRLIVCLL